MAINHLTLSMLASNTHPFFPFRDSVGFTEEHVSGLGCVKKKGVSLEFPGIC